MKRMELGKRFRWEVAASCAALITLLVLPGPQVPPAGASEGDQPAVMRVEEDWRLSLNEPGDDVDAPQFYTAMSPHHHLDSAYAQVLWNYRELPEFEAGGLQVQGWLDEEDVDLREAGHGNLSQDAESVTWTQRLETDGNLVKFRIVQGHSSTWGSFGGDSTEVNIAAPVANLNHYSPLTSKANSGVSYGSNRVSLLIITEVRYYGADGNLIWLDRQPVIVFTLQAASSAPIDAAWQANAN